MAEEWPGIETIRGLVGEPPKEIKVPYKLLHDQQILLQEWNTLFIAIIPYCYKCRTALVWHEGPDDSTRFDCPVCHRKWVKENDWDKEKEKLKWKKSQ